MNTLAVTRPEGQGTDTEKLIRGLGWTPLIVHTVQLRPHPWSKVLSELREAASPNPPNWLVFMSPRGVDLFFDVLKSDDGSLPGVLRQSQILAVGPKTRASLTRQGIPNVYTPDRYSSDGVYEFLAKFPIQDKRVILPRSSQASGTLARKLRETGALVKTIPLYESSIPSDSESVSILLSQLRNGTVNATLFTSALSATNLFEMSRAQSKPESVRELLSSSLIGAIGPTTAAELKRLGVTPAFIPERYTIDRAVAGLVETVEKGPMGPSPLRAFS